MNLTPDPDLPAGPSPSEGPVQKAARAVKRDPRIHPFVIRMSAGELQAIKQQAGRLHLLVAPYLRARIFDYKLPSPRGVIDDKAYLLLSRILVDLRNAGGNINQLAHSSNLGLMVETEEVALALKQFREVADEVRLHLVKIAQNFEGPNEPSDAWTEDED